MKPLFALFVHGSLLAMVIAMGLAGLAPKINDESLLYAASVMLLACALWAMFSWRMLTGSSFDLYILFVLSAVLFNGGQALLEIFSLNENGMLGRYAFSTTTLLNTVYLVSLGLMSLHLGAIAVVVHDSRRRRKSRTGVDQEMMNRSKKALRKVGRGLLWVALIPTVLMFRDAVKTVMSSGYFGLYEMAPDIGLSGWHNILSPLCIPAALFMLAGSKGKSLERYGAISIMCVYVIMMLFLGWRSKAALAVISFCWLWHRSVKRLPTGVIAVAGSILLFVVFPVVKAIRDIPGSERLSLQLVVNNLSLIDHPVVAMISEFGVTMRNVAFTLDLVPRVRPYALGETYMYSLLTLMPNLFWDIHPSQAFHLGSWLTSTVAWKYFAAGGGYGFSVFAEAYLNFGWYGFPPLIALLGGICASLSLAAVRTHDPGRMAMTACFMSFFLIIARAEAMAVVRPLCWYVLVPYLVVKKITQKVGR